MSNEPVLPRGTRRGWTRVGSSRRIDVEPMWRTGMSWNSHGAELPLQAQPGIRSPLDVRDLHHAAQELPSVKLLTSILVKMILNSGPHQKPNRSLR